MADQKDKAQEKKQQAETDDNEQTSGYGKSGGNMGAGKSGKEGMGSEKPSDGEGLGSQKPGGAGEE